MVVTDGYFRTAAAEKEEKKDDASKKKDEKEVKEKKEHDQAVRKARTMSWALTYYLMQQKRDGLVRFFQELSNLPRDLEFDDGVLLAAFGRAFDLIDPSKPNEVNPTKFYNLAKEWYSYIKLTNLETPEILNQARREQQSELKTGNKPATPKRP
jgi:hypothetical protein